MSTFRIRASILLLLVVLPLVACDQYGEVKKQLPTFADMQNLARAIQSVVDEEGSISDEDARKLIAIINDGKDAWGTGLLYKSREDPEFTFLLVSLGRDRKLDVTHLEDYFYVEKRIIEGELDRDIVFLNTDAMTVGPMK